MTEPLTPPPTPLEDDDRLGAIADAKASSQMEPGAGPPPPAPTDADTLRVGRAADALAAAWVVDSEEMAALVRRLKDESRPAPPPHLPTEYEILGEIGRGGTGVVYRARQRSLDRLVAVKVLRAGDLLFGSALERFEREARALARLRHPHIVSVHEVGSADGRLWYAMDLVEGRSLAERLREGPLAPKHAAHLLASVADALSYVHQHGLVHRDVKPANILLDADQKPFVTDFGLVLEIGAEDGLTLTGQIVGTPAYMSPEQARGEAGAVAPATDVYALGVVLYECLTGRRPFQGLSPAEQVYAVIHREPLAPRQIDRRIPEPIERVCLQAMRKKAGDRYPTAAAMRHDLARFVEDRAVAARPIRRIRRIAALATRRRGALGWLVAAALAVALVVTWNARDRTEGAAQSLIDAADEALVRGDGEGASRLYVRAMAFREPSEPDPAFDSKRLDAWLLEARALSDRGKPVEALALLDRAQAEGYERYGRYWSRPGDVDWARAIAMTVAGRFPEAIPIFRESFQARVDANAAANSRASSHDGSRSFAMWDSDAGLAERILRSCATAAVDARAPAHATAAAELRGLFYVNSAHEAALAAGRIAAQNPLLLRPVLETIVERAAPAGPAFHSGDPFSLLVWLRMGLLETATDPVDATLADLADDESWPAMARAAAAALLADIADIPVDAAFRLGYVQDFADVVPADSTRPWRRVRAMSEEAGLAARVEIALKTWSALESEPPPYPNAPLSPHRAALGVLPSWLAARTGMPVPTTVGEARAWLTEQASETAAARLFRALDIPPTADAREVLRRLSGWKTSDAQRARQAHFLLRLLSPPGSAIPRIGATRDNVATVVDRWRRALSGSQSPSRYRARVARLVLDPTFGWRVDPAGGGFLDLEIGRLAELHRQTTEGPIPAPSMKLSLPGTRMTRGTDRGALDVRLTLAWGGQGTVAKVDEFSDRLVGGGFSRTRGSQFSADFVFSPDCSGIGYSQPDPSRNILHLLALEPPGAPDTVWSLDDWRARIAGDLDRAAAAAEGGGAREPTRVEGNHSLYDRQDELLAICQLASRLPVPAALNALRRLQAAFEATRGFEAQQAFCLQARCLARDAELLATPDLDRLFERSWARDSTMAVLQARSWGRVLCTEGPGPLRDVAERRLAMATLEPGVAGDLLDAERAGRMTTPPSIRRKMDEIEVEDRSYIGQAQAVWGAAIPAALLWLGGLLATIFFVGPRRPRWTRVNAAGWLVVIGVLVECYDLLLRGVDVLPDSLGLAWATAGTALLASTVRGRLARTTPWLFGTGLLFAVADLAFDLPAQISGLGGLATWAGVALLPVLAARLRGATDRAGRPRVGLPIPFVVFYVLPWGVLWVVVLVGWIRGRVPSWTVTGTFADLWMLAMAVCVLWALFAVRYSAGVRAAWLRAQVSAVAPQP